MKSKCQSSMKSLMSGRLSTAPSIAPMKPTSEPTSTGGMHVVPLALSKAPEKAVQDDFSDRDHGSVRDDKEDSDEQQRRQENSIWEMLVMWLGLRFTSNIRGSHFPKTSTPTM